MDQEGNAKPKANVLSLTIRDKAVLYATYMPFIKRGGLFIPTNKRYELGDEINMYLNLMEETEKILLSAKVVWITPSGAQGNRAAGVGVQFQGEEGIKARNKIETYLAGALKSERPTHTL
ncbi:PilZ domain-containing protein [Candidatus Berkiella aquae]|nr:PilZ domain-containing protein [Candidatus Berkiella aquae]MCS5711769.1 PilZ domain-containing protein [Candidatus Berkiella aquae]